MVTRGTVDSSVIDLAIRHLLPQLLGDFKVCLELYIWQHDQTFPQVNGVWWVAKLCGLELPWRL
jgi:hypothetical protein